MNYIKEIKAFHDLVQIKQLSTGQIALWYALMYVNNKCAWTEWFTVPNMTLELNCGLSRKGIYNARNTLKQYGIIDFKTNGTKATSYKLISLLNITQDSTQDNKTLQDITQGTTQDTTQESTQGTTQDSATLNKLNEMKLNDDYNNNGFSSIRHKFENNGFGLINITTAQIIIDLIEDYSIDWVSDAMDVAIESNVRNIKYVKGILKRWRANGKDTGFNKDKKDEHNPYAGYTWEE